MGGEQRYNKKHSAVAHHVAETCTDTCTHAGVCTCLRRLWTPLLGRIGCWVLLGTLDIEGRPEGACGGPAAAAQDWGAPGSAPSAGTRRSDCAAHTASFFCYVPESGRLSPRCARARGHAEGRASSVPLFTQALSGPSGEAGLQRRCCARACMAVMPAWSRADSAPDTPAAAWLLSWCECVGRLPRGPAAAPSAPPWTTHTWHVLAGDLDASGPMWQCSGCWQELGRGTTYLGEGVQRFEVGAAYRAGKLLEPVMPWDLQ